MATMKRREFLKMGSGLAALMGLGTTAIPSIVQALEDMSTGRLPVLWLQGQSCSGCSVSVLNSSSPGIVEVLSGYISLKFHGTLSTATGDKAMDVVDETILSKNYYLVVEGSIPAAMPRACMMGHHSFVDILKEAVQKSKAVIAVGACAANGGIPAAEGNPTGAVSVSTFFEGESLSKPLINLPGCPVHPDWLVGTIVHLKKFGLPKLDNRNRPQVFFSKKLHDQCQRFPDYERERFAKTFSDDGCYFKLGCAGPITYADCTVRNWNSGVNNCIRAGASCIGCAGEHFALKKSFPFYLKNASLLKEKVS